MYMSDFIKYLFAFGFLFMICIKPAKGRLRLYPNKHCHIYLNMYLNPKHYAVKFANSGFGYSNLSNTWPGNGKTNSIKL